MTDTNTRKGRPPLTHGRTAFGDYLVFRGITHNEAAKELGKSRVYVTGLARGLSKPSAALMFEIKTWSNDVVTMESWFAAVRTETTDERLR